MLHFVTSYMKQNKSRKQTLESAQYGLEISFNVCKIFISLACYWQIGSKSTNCSYKCDLLTFSMSFYQAVIGGFRSDLSTVAASRPAHRLCKIISKSLKPIFFAIIAHTVKQMGRKSNCLLVKELNVCSVTARKPFVACGFCGVKISHVIGYNTINIPDIF